VSLNSSGTGPDDQDMGRFGLKVGHWALAAAGVSVALAGCGAGSTTTARAPSNAGQATTTTAPAKPWQSSGLRIVSTPEIGGGVVLGVDGSSADLQVVAFDETTGSVLWRQPWSPSGMFPGMGVGSRHRR
jgi:hypothetical protein